MPANSSSRRVRQRREVEDVVPVGGPDREEERGVVDEAVALVVVAVAAGDPAVGGPDRSAAVEPREAQVLQPLVCEGRDRDPVDHPGVVGLADLDAARAQRDALDPRRRGRRCRRQRQHHRQRHHEPRPGHHLRHVHGGACSQVQRRGATSPGDRQSDVFTGTRARRMRKRVTLPTKPGAVTRTSTTAPGRSRRPRSSGLSAAVAGDRTRARPPGEPAAAARAAQHHAPALGHVAHAQRPRDRARAVAEGRPLEDDPRRDALRLGVDGRRRRSRRRLARPRRRDRRRHGHRRELDRLAPQRDVARVDHRAVGPLAAVGDVVAAAADVDHVVARARLEHVDTRHRRRACRANALPTTRSTSTAAVPAERPVVGHAR